MLIAKADNIECSIVINRLREYVTLNDVCNYIGIKSIDLRIIKNIQASNKFQPESERTEMYHLKKIKYFIDHGIDKPIDIDCFCKNNVVYPWPVIIDGRHRYIAAILRGDQFIKSTYSGRKDLMDYLTFKSNT